MSSIVPPFTPPPDIEEADAFTSWAESLPASRSLGLAFDVVERGRVVATLAHAPWPLNPNGSVFGGLVLAAADQVMGMAAITIQRPGGIIATASLTMDFPRPAIAPLTLAANVSRAGRTLAFIELTIVDADQRLCGRAIGTWSINLDLP